MKAADALLLSIAALLAGWLYYPGELALWAVLAALGGICATWLWRHPRQHPPTTSQASNNTKKGAEKAGHVRGGWAPGLGIGFSLLHWPPHPFVFLTLARWRLRK